ncbi:MAG: DUF6760 family protein, partial [Chloroflexota bacterium]
DEPHPGRVSGLPARVRGGGDIAGGIAGYPLDQLYEEVAFIAYYFHWPVRDIYELEHPDRRRWVEEISAINQRLREETEEMMQT